MPELPVLFSEFVRLEIELWNAVEARLRRDCDIPLGWFETLQVVDRVPDCRVHDIATELHITVGGTSKLVDRVVGAGLCRRRSNPHDQRSSIIVITTAGRRKLRSATAAVTDELEHLLGSALSAREIQQLNRIVAKLRTNRAGDERTTS